MVVHFIVSNEMKLGFCMDIDWNSVSLARYYVLQIAEALESKVHAIVKLEIYEII